jgi:hypothetical protein
MQGETAMRAVEGDDPPDLRAPGPIDCPRCGAGIKLYQPDVETPERLLGICPACKSWYLVDAVSGRLRALATDEDRPAG